MSHELPDGWQWVQLRSICDFAKGRSETMKTRPGPYPFVVTAESRSTADSYQFEEPAVCVPLISSTGHGDAAIHRVHYQDGKFAVANLLVALTSKDRSECDVEYLYHLFMAKKDEYFVPLMTGTANVSLRIEDIELTRIPLPPIAEQCRIAAVLRDADASIARVEESIAAAQVVKRGVMARLFRYGMAGEGAPTKHTLIGEIPTGWGLITIGQIFEVQLGKMLSQAAKRGVNPRPYVGNINVQWGYVDTTDLKEMDFSPYEMQKFRLRKGDILVCEGGEVGRTAIWNDEIEECYYQKAIHRLRPHDGVMLPTFFQNYMELTFRIRKASIVEGSGSTIAHLPAEKLIALPIALPSLDDQREIAAILQRHDDAVRTMQAEADRLREVKRGLMQSLLSGQVRV